jgi:S1-C subfamily serine protease
MLILVVFVQKITNRIKATANRVLKYIHHLLFPLYLFPIKLLTYAIFYLLKCLFEIIVKIFKIFIQIIIGTFKLYFDFVTYPFRSFRNFLKSICILLLVVYVGASLFVIVDYIHTHYGYYQKFLCSAGTSDKLKKSVVRIIGGESQGTGFFISSNQVLTNFHVINGEPSPKIIFPDGNFITPIKITGDKDADLAILYTDQKYPHMVMSLPDFIQIKDEEPLLATGFPMGTDLAGKATVLRGDYIDFRKSKSAPVGYLQTNISLVEGMSGGPLTDQCGSVVGVNTMGLAGLSLFISGSEAKDLIPKFTDQEVKKINVDPTKSPQDAVTAFYTYLKARKMKDGFNLLSQEYLQKTNFEEWTNRFKDVLDVTIFKSEMFENSKDTVTLKFGTENWVDQDMETHYYEGTWQTIFEDGKYKMLKSKIKEVEDPDYTWFYE